jgi:hypothetical protein
VTTNRAQELLIWLQLWRELKQNQNDKLGIKVPPEAYTALQKHIDDLIAEVANDDPPTFRTV